MVVDEVLRALASISLIEWSGVALALAYLVLAVRQSPWCWLFAGVSSVVYLWLFARTGLTMQAALQVFYVAMAVYGWYSWRRSPDAAAPQRQVVRWRPGWHVYAWIAIAIASAINVALLRDSHESRTVLVSAVDAVVAWGSVLTTWMVARKVLENWLYWIVLDLLAAALYWSQGLYATTVLFVVYAVIAARGFVEWRATMRESASPPQSLPVDAHP